MEKERLRKQLSPKEYVFLRRIITWNKFSRLKEEFIYRIILILGGVFVVVSVYNTIKFLSDKTALFVTIPGVLTGILFLWFYRSGMNRIKEKKKLADILERLLSGEE